MASQTFIDGTWHEGNPPILGPMSHATWLGSIIFDGARAFEGVAPDLMLHCRRAINSAERMLLKPKLAAEEVFDICWEGVRKFPSGAELYIRPMFFAEGGWIDPDPESTRFVCSVYDSPLPPATGFTSCVSSLRRPAPAMAPTDAKASALYPNAGRAMKEARERGFENGIMLDPIGNVAEFATSNLFIVKDGVVITPAPNGTFLNGITRQRVIKLLRGAGREVHEGRVTVEDVLAADEVFSTGNYGKVQPVTRVEARDFQPGPVFAEARKLYWDFAHS
ncbi:MAG: branched-chain amino acid aminotransferase [Thalassobaculales bacterium]